MVPNRAIIRDKSATFVQVMVNGTPETRPVTLGFTNGLNTEVTKGLSEGEEVVIQEPKTTTSSTQSQSNSNVRIFIR